LKYIQIAARFAAREVLFKALSYAQPNYSLPFLTLCSRISIVKADSRPYIVINGDIGIDLSGTVFHLSLSHNRIHATAFIVIERQIV
jgi:phosphopantetheinyl transferase (holo-ACP synthase)